MANFVKGEKRSPNAGRRAGTPNKRTAAIKQAMEGGVTPLEYLLNVMRNESASADMRLEAAKAAAPYCHPKLTQQLGKDGQPVDPGSAQPIINMTVGTLPEQKKGNGHG